MWGMQDPELMYAYESASRIHNLRRMQKLHPSMCVVHAAIFSCTDL